jgi:hypothetical protein
VGVDQERPMAEYFDELAPSARYDRAISDESKGLLFAVNLEGLRMIAVPVRLTPGKRVE